MVLASLRSDDWEESEDSTEETVRDVYRSPNSHQEAVRRSNDLTNSWDGTGSISARNRHRETQLVSGRYSW